MTTRRVESFLLRIVVTEEQTRCPKHWRGRIQHVTSGVEQQIADLAEAIAFISAHLETVGDLSLEIEEEIAPPPAI
jgi:hypothetical protein